MQPALLWESVGDGTVRCRLCAHRCTIADGKTGICRVRKNHQGQLVSLVSDRIIAANGDPIEKKPMYHFLPGSQSFSVATMGCNFRCTFCQNHNLSLVDDDHPIQGRAIPPGELVEAAVQMGAASIAYTYTEPTVFFELMLETAALARKRGLKNVMVTNGYISREALDKLAPWLDGANIDLKAFSDAFYRRYAGARLEPVLDTIGAMKAAGVWVEITTLLIPDLNDDMDEIAALIRFIRELDPATPWHVSRFYPTHRMRERRPTDSSRIFAVLDKAEKSGLQYLYAGNVSDRKWADTHCTGCGATLISRSGYSADTTGMSHGRCGKCSTPVAGVWSQS